jgi:AcrR family transcriptional regulator
MARRPGMRELAAAAGLSLATVDRALNGRETVRPETRARLAEVAARIGHPAAARLLGERAVQPEVTFGVVLHKQGQDFYKAFAEELPARWRPRRACAGGWCWSSAPASRPAKWRAICGGWRGAATCWRRPRSTTPK